MPKKGATIGEKPSGMTEERLVSTQQRAQAEEEMANRKEDMPHQFHKASNYIEVPEDQEIITNAKRLQKMQDSILALRSQMASSQREAEGVAQGLRADKEELTLQIRQLRDQMSRTHDAEKRQLTNLVLHSNAAKKKLQGIVSKGERVLRLAEMCRKLETEHEKVLPFYTSSLSPEEESQERATFMEPPSEGLAQAMLDYTGLERFWQRYNKVLLEQRCLEKERQAMTQENQQLQVLLRQYSDGISVSDKTFHHNPLLTVSRPTLGIPPTADTQRKHCTIIEAAHIVQHKL